MDPTAGIKVLRTKSGYSLRSWFNRARSVTDPGDGTRAHIDVETGLAKPIPRWPDTVDHLHKTPLYRPDPSVTVRSWKAATACNDNEIFRAWL